MNTFLTFRGFRNTLHNIRVHEQIAISGQQFLLFGLVSVACFFRRLAINEALHLLEDLCACMHNWGEMALELFEGGGVVVADLLDDEAEDEPCLGGEHTILRKLRQYVIAQIVDVLGLWGDVLCGIYGMKKAVDKCLTLMEVTFVKW